MKKKHYEDERKITREDLETRIKFINDLSIVLIKAGITINGAALIGLLTFMGNLEINIGSLPIIIFSIGVFLSFVSGAITYLSQCEFIKYERATTSWLKVLTNQSECENPDELLVNATYENYKKSHDINLPKGNFIRNIAITFMGFVALCFCMGCIITAYQIKKTTKKEISVNKKLDPSFKKIFSDYKKGTKNRNIEIIGVQQSIPFEYGGLTFNYSYWVSKEYLSVMLHQFVHCECGELLIHANNVIILEKDSTEKMGFEEIFINHIKARHND